jgi:hypothetical protein
VRTLLAILAAVVLGASFAGDAPLRLAARAPLTSGRDGSGPILDAPAGTPVVVLERSGDRVRVRVEGWIPASALAGSAPLPIAAIEGTISLDAKWARKRTGAGAQVWLLPAGTAGFEDGDEEARLDALAAEMARLETAAAKALEGGPTFTEATRKHDEIMAARHRVGRERDDLVASVHARHEGIALKSAIASAFADERGIFKVAAPPGAYLLYARFLRGELDVEWVANVSAPSRTDLDETRALHPAP